MIKAMRFNAHSLLLCGLFGHDRVVAMRNLAYFRLLIDSLIHFRATPGKWLESACSAVIWGELLLVCGLYDGIGQQTQGCMPVGLHY